MRLIFPISMALRAPRGVGGYYTLGTGQWLVRPIWTKACVGMLPIALPAAFFPVSVQMPPATTTDPGPNSLDPPYACSGPRPLRAAQKGGALSLRFSVSAQHGHMLA